MAEGDDAAFNLVVQEYAGKIYAVALGYIKIVESAEDITQEVFYKMWKGREKMDRIDSLKDYLFIITRNEVLSALRKKGPAYPVGEYLENALEEKDMLPEQAFSYRQFQHITLTAISLLPPQQKQAYLLSREEGLSHDEIALKMDLSKNTVKNHIVAALNFIRQHIRTHSDIIFLLLMVLSFRAA